MLDDATDDTTESHVIQMKRCPLCSTTIRLSLRYGNVIKQQLQDIAKVKAKMRKRTSRGLSEKMMRLLNRLTKLSAKFSGETYHLDWVVLVRGVRKLKNGLMAALLENKVMLMERFCVMKEKIKANASTLTLDVCKETNLNGKSTDKQHFVLLTNPVITSSILDRMVTHK